jgi:hypothetical protein
MNRCKGILNLQITSFRKRYSYSWMDTVLLFLMKVTDGIAFISDLLSQPVIIYNGKEKEKRQGRKL